MTNLTNKKIVLGITGGIAAYKCAELVRRLKDAGCEVKVVMTESAKHFITPLTMQAVSGETVSDSLLDPSAEASMGHIEFAKWADLILVAPATCNIIAKMAAPAMNQQMYAHAATQANLATLKARNVLIWGPGKGEQACGDIGAGRMLEPHELVALCIAKEQPQLLAGKTITITAGPTREPLDPVRFISNHSSGKMGYALAEAALQFGAKVNLISGPVTIKAPTGVNLINIESAEELLTESLTYASQSDAFIGCAAVADYRAANIATQKMKKQGDELTLTLTKNPDVIAAIANLTQNRPYTVGFAAETQNVESYAKGKLQNKNLDMICANDVSKSGLGFNSDHNALTLYWHNEQLELPTTSKVEIARKVIEQLAKHL
ncbi:bifunctional phosphopantothenoylcysteine decarboxylase/phosphopantothenate--cysteine ligase CoaBC [Pseudoalteromonas sp. TAE80]|uniref:bifunctional phosphopantothenoylcysteine decarboxylase/phosphopantothenate--cysteine ligase CoaBC n=1 Tax=Pseudoalteromonas sp. TAE80 TaxID=1938598 RepID=UPI0004656D90|nr:bifunctional phosphopantothenoylcysteine decarboxylase/phosphopantothenate--cysteine ligase CoaBC [Pseudoalteromonas sp. TAE80]